MIPVQISELSIQDPLDSVFSFKDSFIQKINKLHPYQDEPYLGLNSMDELEVAFLTGPRLPKTGTRCRFLTHL